jgi:hypothetical protein
MRQVDEERIGESSFHRVERSQRFYQLTPATLIKLAKLLTLDVHWGALLL